MVKDFSEHEWVADYSNYEAVLVCRNELDSWDQGRCMRAFQTFKWEALSTSGDDMCFKHIETGALVRYDGAVVAIDTTHEEQAESLQDLFRVLHGLGWVNAELYHSLDTMAHMLKDMGKAIPANLDFDIQPAAALKDIKNIPEANAMVERGKEILMGAQAQRSNENTDNSEVMAELQNIEQKMAGEKMNYPLPSAPLSFPALSGGAFDGIDLEDDESAAKTEESSDYEPEQSADSEQESDEPMRTMPITADHGIFSEDDLQETAPLQDSAQKKPDVFNSDEVGIENKKLRKELIELKNLLVEQIKEQKDIDKNAAEAKWSLAREQALTKKLSEEHSNKEKMFQEQHELLLSQINELNSEIAASIEREEIAGENSHKEQELREKLMNENDELRQDVQIYIEAQNERDIIEQAMKKIVKFEITQIGKSIFCFETPESRLSADAVEKIAADYGIEKIVQLDLGAVDQDVRWDVLGDASEKYPWEVEKLVTAMGFSASNSSVVASILLDLKSRVSQAQLRDLLKICASSGFDTKVKIDQLLENEFSPNVSFLLSRLLSADLVEILDEIVLRLSPLVLCEDGQSFVDVRAQKPVSTFTMRGLIDSEEAQVFVVRVDALDGPFVKSIGDLLRVMAQGYGSTSRYAPALPETSESTEEQSGDVQNDKSTHASDLAEVKMPSIDEKTMTELAMMMGKVFLQMQRQNSGG